MQTGRDTGKCVLAPRLGADHADDNHLGRSERTTVVGILSQQLTASIGPTGVPTVPLPQTFGCSNNGEAVYKEAVDLSPTEEDVALR